ncbi:binding-protein-dependent permease [Aliidongia dinghuensis]|uniref:Binding-protein-dependent permease n=1 Tax=Aliidongia dinghuensis TaxID=1867774 RepID=A0A8J3E6I4_9PROT|nr:ABC transporter permease [Aliidongia dinghuensis]GGF41474.1 binding-protein-dependent permease [Aliidongia dinghuensis]
MIVFLLRRLLQSLAVMLAVALIAFSLFRYVGDPINAMVSQDATQAERDALRQSLGLNDSILVQFGRFVGRTVQGEFGLSYQLARPVNQIILEKMPATLELSFAAGLIALVAGVALGVFTGLKPRALTSRFLLAGSLVGVSLPTFLIGILLILVFSVWLRWLPSYGRGPTVQFGWWSSGLFSLDGWRSILMPAITLALYPMTLIIRLVRAEMLEVLRTDYIKFARARGLTPRAIHFGHALKNTLVPVITITGVQVGSIIAFAVITETVFQWPGMGLMFIQAVSYSDIPVMSAYLVLVAFFFVVISLVVDLLYYVVDPRLRLQRGGGGHAR